MIKYIELKLYKKCLRPRKTIDNQFLPNEALHQWSNSIKNLIINIHKLKLMMKKISSNLNLKIENLYSLLTMLNLKLMTLSNFTVSFEMSKITYETYMILEVGWILILELKTSNFYKRPIIWDKSWATESISSMIKKYKKKERHFKEIKTISNSFTDHFKEQLLILICTPKNSLKNLIKQKKNSNRWQTKKF